MRSIFALNFSGAIMKAARMAARRSKPAHPQPPTFLGSSSCRSGDASSSASKQRLDVPQEEEIGEEEDSSKEREQTC